MAKNESLFENFPAVTTEKWMDKIVADLKGDDFERRLVWKTNEGFDLMPFYRREDLVNLKHIDTLPGSEPYLRGSRRNGNDWLIRQNIRVEDFKAANRKALDILSKGVGSLGFIIADPESINAANLETLLMGINPEKIELNFCSEGKAKEILDIYRKIVEEKGSSRAGIKGAIEADPLSRFMLNGKLCLSIDAGLDYLAELTKNSESLPMFKTVHVNASVFPDAGADVVTELAFGLSMGNEYISVLTDRDITPDMAASKIRFCFGTGSNYFFEIAKLRAARVLWNVITGGYKNVTAPNKRMEIHSVTGNWNKTLYDPFVNLLRTQTEAMSSALGGADSITVDPFDKVPGTQGEFSERLARNQQLLLKEEAYLDKVADPAGGSYYIEMVTSMISESSWKLFLEVEEKGGYYAALKKGFIQDKLKEIASKRAKDVARRKEILVGTNQYPDYNERKTGYAGNNGIRREERKQGDELIEPVRLFRGAEDIEKLRLAADKAPERPTAFMLTIGNPVMRSARSQFSGNFFAAGGYNVTVNPGFNTPEEGVKAALDLHSDIIVICSSDEEYAEFAPRIFSLVNGKAIVVVAGYPACMNELKRKGLEHFISVRSDLVETLDKFHRLTGIIKST